MPKKWDATILMDRQLGKTSALFSRIIEIPHSLRPPRAPSWARLMEAVAEHKPKAEI